MEIEALLNLLASDDFKRCFIDDDLEESSSIPPARFDFLIRTLNFMIPFSQASEIFGIGLVSKGWLSEHYGQDDGGDYAEEEAVKEDKVKIPHGEPVTLETFVAWRERFEAELALERAKLMAESALTRRQWFESGRARGAVLTADQESEEEDDEDIAFEDDEEDMLEHYLAEKSDASAPIARA
ncbi:hypothetical protein IGI04_022124 [Brassica rapa subsp. trilocularis]|uniref:RWD domain-containing protein n=1 Tax=Brassica rapa subsp. trilocularis TaxID=1813537 RepID=A0ABQ7M024_BRACM|nr:hypothetical protein IGI04_022124 [Brassica rapa subsp. trilocularis]